VIRTCDKDCKKENGNCPVPAEDGLPAQCVGFWASDKYFFLDRYLSATSEARRMFADKGNAVFIDLFCGPGKCIVRDEGREIDSGGFRAVNLKKVPFNECILSDIDAENIDSFKKRVTDERKCVFVQGDSNKTVKNTVAYLKTSKFNKYHFAYIDPFAPSGLKFDTLKELAQLQRMDMLIHFPIGAIKRNIEGWHDRTDTILDSFLGTTAWRDKIAEAIKHGQKNVYPVVLDIFKQQLKGIGYPEEGLKLHESAVPVKNKKEVNLYVLVLAAKHKLAQKIWDSVIRIDPTGQRNLI